MCYSARIRADYAKFVRQYDASVSLEDFFQLYWLRQQDGKAKVPRALDAAFLDDPAAARLHPLIHAHAAAEATRLEQELFAQRARLVKAERVLATKPTKKAADDQRIATSKIAKAQARIYEVPISYSGRTYAEGKKINWTDGVAAFWHILKYNLAG